MREEKDEEAAMPVDCCGDSCKADPAIRSVLWYQKINGGVSNSPEMTQWSATPLPAMT